MPTPIKMPALSPTMEEGTLAKWLVKPGDTVSAGDIMAEIETDKATMEFEAVDEGTIASIAVEAGTAHAMTTATAKTRSLSVVLRRERTRAQEGLNLELLCPD